MPAYIASGLPPASPHVDWVFKKLFCSPCLLRMDLLPPDAPPLTTDKGAAVDFLVLMGARHVVGFPASSFSTLLMHMREVFSVDGTFTFIDEGNVIRRSSNLTHGLHTSCWNLGQPGQPR